MADPMMVTAAQLTPLMGVVAQLALMMQVVARQIREARTREVSTMERLITGPRTMGKPMMEVDLGSRCPGLIC